MNKQKAMEICEKYTEFSNEFDNVSRDIIKQRNVYIQFKDLINNIINYVGNIIDFMKTISKNDLLKLTEVFINVMEEGTKLFNYLLKNNFVKEEFEILVKNLVSDMKKTNKVKGKIEKSYIDDDDDEEFLWYASWFL